MALIDISQQLGASVCAQTMRAAQYSFLSQIQLKVDKEMRR